MSPPRFTAGQAGTSCHRCHRRKKRCDRALPQCGNCRLARIACSFVEDDRQVGFYPIVFVRGLESRVRDLERELAAVAAMSSVQRSPGLRDIQSLQANLPKDTERGERNTRPQRHFAMDDGVIPNHIPAAASLIQPSPSSLFEELKLLSLEATAEQHLGPSSGLSFARLTQTVLRRLSPDKADFVFSNEDEEENGEHAPAPVAFNSPPEVLNSIFDTADYSLSCYPTLFGAFSLSDLTEPEDVLAGLGLPDEAHCDHLVKFYFAHSHTLYPIIHREEFMTEFKQVYADPQHPLTQSAMCMFKIWMVLAIGSTTYCSVMLTEESEPMLYYNKAMIYFEAAFSRGGMASLEVLVLQVSYSFFNQLGPNTWCLIGLAARMAVGMGLHMDSTYASLPTDAAERRKRLFFSIYMMDRVASVALGRPFALHDDDINVSPFADADDDEIKPDGIHRQDSFKPSTMAVPLHILALRRIASKISTTVYSHTQASRIVTREERAEAVRKLHKELIDWRRNMPFPLQDTHPRVPHLSSIWYDFNFYTHLAMLYRPSPLFATLDQIRVKQLAEAAAMSIRQAVNLHRQQRFAYNWLNLLALFTSALSLIYAVTAQPDELSAVLRETRAVDDLDLAMQLFGTLSIKFKAAKKIERMVKQIVSKYRQL